jgi:hypothetical protein
VKEGWREKKTEDTGREYRRGKKPGKLKKKKKTIIIQRRKQVSRLEKYTENKRDAQRQGIGQRP